MATSAGLIRGDGHLGSLRIRAPERRRRTASTGSGLALADREALDRAQAFLLADERATTREFGSSPQRPPDTGRSRRSMRNPATTCERVRELIAWPRIRDDDWRKGFLAGIFDAEGSCSRGVLRISNTDAELIDWTTYCLRRFGFDFVIERARRTGA